MPRTEPTGHPGPGAQPSSFMSSVQAVLGAPDDLGYLRSLGRAALARRDGATAVWALTRAIVAAATAERPLAIRDRGMGFEISGKFENAISDYRWVVLHSKDGELADWARKRLLTCLFLLERNRDLVVAAGPWAGAPRNDPKVDYMIGFALLQSHRREEALLHADACLKRVPAHAGARYVRGEVRFSQSRYLEAIDDLTLSAEAEPDRSAARYRLARCHIALEQIEEGIALLNVLMDDPEWRDQAARGLAEALVNHGRQREAVEAIRHLHKIERKTRRNAITLADALIEDERPDEAVQVMTDTLDEAPDDAYLWNELCNRLKSHAEYDVSMLYYGKAHAQFPMEPVIAYNMGQAANETFDVEKAFLPLRRAVVVQPDYARGWNANSVVHCMIHEAETGYQCARRALTITPDSESAILNLGVVERARNNYPGAVAAHRRAVELKPSPINLYSLSFTLLLCGEIEQGFKLYEHRWGLDNFTSPKRPFPQRVWKGEEIREPNQKLLIYMEQGMGDEIMFAWFLPLVADRVRHLMAECDDRLVPLFARTFPQIEVQPRGFPPVPDTLAPEVVRKAPAGHAPQFFSIELRELIRRSWSDLDKRIHRGGGYMVPDPEERSRWRTWLDEISDKPRIGICWRSSVHNRVRDMQYLQPEELAKAVPPGVVLVNLQYDWLEEEIDQFRAAGEEGGFEIVTPPDLDLRDDLDEMTALCQELDMILTPMISTAFMGSSVGTPTWVFRTNEADRIWQQLGTPGVPWLPAMRLFFRHPNDPWSKITPRIRIEMDAVLASGEVYNPDSKHAPKAE